MQTDMSNRYIISIGVQKAVAWGNTPWPFLGGGARGGNIMRTNL